jgi:hypothetical protein
VNPLFLCSSHPSLSLRPFNHSTTSFSRNTSSHQCPFFRTSTSCIELELSPGAELELDP